MGIVGTFILVVFVISALLLILIVLVQDDQGEGLGGIFGGGSGSAFGPRSGNVLTKITSVLAIIFFLGAFGLAWLNRTPEAENLVGKARVETLQKSKNDWWVEIKKEQKNQASTSTAGATENSSVKSVEGNKETKEKGNATTVSGETKPATNSSINKSASKEKPKEKK